MLEVCVAERLSHSEMLPVGHSCELSVCQKDVVCGASIPPEQVQLGFI